MITVEAPAVTLPSLETGGGGPSLLIGWLGGTRFSFKSIWRDPVRLNSFFLGPGTVCYWLFFFLTRSSSSVGGTERFKPQEWPTVGQFIIFIHQVQFIPLPYGQKGVRPCDVGRLGDRSVGCLHSAYGDLSIGKV